ncbi:hypothetical protein [Micromonospora profundi]|uniref:Uncharacterized protein n=1 Tax=Micromonospora profundi TaxID=1420889 RepID=A0AAJ6HXX1_9ACTN|nr:hypothetical protein [Micromonospora profundi]WLS48282.1 hypothetical protein Q3V37_14230 [Micromonospora profundi]
MLRHRVLAVLLLLIAFVALVLSHTFPFLDDLSELEETAIVVVGAVCCLAGVSLWLRKAPRGDDSPPPA